MGDHYRQSDFSRRSNPHRRRTPDRQPSQDYDQPYPFSTYSASDSSGGSSRHYGSSSDGYSRGRPSSASSIASSRSDPYFQDPQPRYDRQNHNKKKSASGKVFSQMLTFAVPLLESALYKAGVQEGDIDTYINEFKHPLVRSSGSRNSSHQSGDIDITDRLQAVVKLVLKNHQKDIQKLVFTAVLSKVTKFKI